MGKDHDFLDAARSGNVLFIEKVLNQKAKRSGPLASLRRGPVVNVQDSSGYSALHHACLNGHIDIVRLLLAYEASPNLPDVRGSSPLHLAAWAGHTNIVKMLLMHPYKPANTNFQTIENETPLHCAAQHGHTGALSALLAHDADPNIRNIRNETPLDLAAQYGRLKAVEILIRSHPELIAPNISENSQSLPAHTCLHLASRNGHKNVVEVLLAAGVDVNLRAISGSALHEAALCGKESVVRTLLKAGIDLNATDAEGRTALDILKEFPPHVTRDIILVIDYFKSQMEATKSDQISQQAQMCSENNYPGRSQLRPQNHHYHFNSNNHLLNHTLSVQQPIQQYSNKGQNRNDVNSCAAPRDNRIKQSPNALEEIKCNLGEGNLLFARTTNDSQK